MKVLVVEDDETILDVYGFYIELALGIDTYDVCKNGKDAIAKINSKEYDIIFLDNALPDMDGVSVASHIPCTSNIIVVSGDVSVKTEQDYNKLGVTHFADKPIDVDELKLELSSILD